MTITEDIQNQINQIYQKCLAIKPIVAIRCLTYNQEKYIHDTLEGFVMQKTDFPFVAIVHDDASNDGTANIIRDYAEKYPEIIIPIIETENQYSKHDGSLGRIMNKACEETGAKYYASCEGDDYWTDPYKLQKQVDFLEAHPDYSMVYTAFHTCDQDGKPFHSDTYQYLLGLSESGDILPKLLSLNFILTCTICYRKEVLDSLIYRSSPFTLDYNLFLCAAWEGKLKFLEDYTATYRIQPNSLVRTKSNYVSKTCGDIQRYFIKKWLKEKRYKSVDNDKDEIFYHLIRRMAAQLRLYKHDSKHRNEILSILSHKAMLSHAPSAILKATKDHFHRNNLSVAK